MHTRHLSMCVCFFWLSCRAKEIHLGQHDETWKTNTNGRKKKTKGKLRIDLVLWCCNHCPMVLQRRETKCRPEMLASSPVDHHSRHVIRLEIIHQTGMAQINRRMWSCDRARGRWNNVLHAREEKGGARIVSLIDRNAMQTDVGGKYSRWSLSFN